MHYDLKIINGTIIDGTGKTAYAGDVAVRDGTIVGLGNIGGDAEKTIDAEGKIVCPGFVDIHTHYDAQLLWGLEPVHFAVARGDYRSYWELRFRYSANAPQSSRFNSSYVGEGRRDEPGGSQVGIGERLGV